MSTPKQLEALADQPKPKPSKDLVYIGNGGFLPNIPARDLSAAEIAALSPEGTTAKAMHDWLIATGLYSSSQNIPESE